MLRDELKFQPHTLAETQKLNPRDLVSRKIAHEAFFENIPQDTLALFSDEALFHLSQAMNVNDHLAQKIPRTSYLFKGLS